MHKCTPYAGTFLSPSEPDEVMHRRQAFEMGADNQSDKVTLIIADPETHPLAPWSHCAQTIIHRIMLFLLFDCFYFPLTAVQRFF